MFSILVPGIDVKDVLSAYADAVRDWSGVCPVCHEPLQKNGTYPRLTPVEIGPWRVQLVRCSADAKHGSHALLPCWVLPHQQSFIETQQRAFEGLANSDTVERVAEDCSVEPKAVARWWRKFHRCLDDILNQVSKLLADLHDLSSWVTDPGNTPQSRAQKALDLMAKVKDTGWPSFPHCSVSLLVLLRPKVFQRFR